MSEVAQIIITTASVITALGVILGAVLAITKKYLQNERQDEDIKRIKEEQSILTKGVLACLKGLVEIGCDGPCKDGIKTIEDHLNKEAHK